MIETIKREWSAQVALLFLLAFSAWWFFILLTGAVETPQNYQFGATYGLVTLWGGFWGLVASKKWGGFASTIGKALIFLSLGLLSQEFGQLVFSYYNIFLNVEIPYPSLADIGFFGTIPFYIVGMSLIAKLSGVKFSLKTVSSQLQAIAIPVVMLSVSYFLFLREYAVDLSDPLKVFLDFGYPLGQAIFISIAILAYSLSRKILGGIMRNKILVLIAALLAQYLADFNFIFQNSRGTWINGGYGDYIYLLAYFVMTIGLIQMNYMASKLTTQD